MRGIQKLIITFENCEKYHLLEFNAFIYYFKPGF